MDEGEVSNIGGASEVQFKLRRIYEGYLSGTDLREI
jgi:hypothetical protein